MINFLCIGAQKAGTTTLYNVLKQHSQIYLPPAKEIYFFSNDDLYARGEEWYHSHFRGKKNERAIGEITPDYLSSLTAPQRIFSYNDEMKLIVLLRDPAERAFSQYLMKTRNGRENRSFADCVDRDLENLNKGLNGTNTNSYLGRGLYSRQIARYLEYFSPGNFHVVMFEDFARDQEGEIKKILAFLGVNEDETLDYRIKSNQFFVPRFKYLHRIYNNVPNRVKRKYLRKVPSWLRKPFKGLYRKEMVKEKMPEEAGYKAYRFLKSDMEELKKYNFIPEIPACWHRRQPGEGLK